MKRLLILLASSLFLQGCTGLPENVQPVEGFQLERYLGTWYEIARLDHSFEQGMSQVTAVYTVDDDGSVKVINKGYLAADKRWKQAEGEARFVGSEDTAHLKVSFFGPFYGSYVVFELDKENYEYAFVSGYNKKYLWLLARKPQVSDALLEAFVENAKRLGFATEELILVEHN